ncbi:hypothetical protein EG66_01930 [Helicobacter pylori]|nr:hypothetical protein EG66_01930 [Helicobacter pylori]
MVGFNALILIKALGFFNFIPTISFINFNVLYIFKNGVLKFFYRFSSHFIVKLILLKFYFLENTGSALKSFSLPFSPTNPP